MPLRTSFDEVVASGGVEIIRTPVRAPDANAICEKVVGTRPRKYLDRLLICGHRHLHTVLTQYPLTTTAIARTEPLDSDVRRGPEQPGTRRRLGVHDHAV
jgi:hypothetical protein